MRTVTLFLLMLISSAATSAELPARKVSHISGEINEEAARTYFEETKATLDLPGNRTIYIDSLGGELRAGQIIIDMMEAEKAHGVKMVCIVTNEATSMAFNILTHCDGRYASHSARFLVHKAALGGWIDGLRPTAKNLRTMANELERADMPYREANMKAMHLTPKEYDDNADQERTWTADELYRMGYIHGFVK